LFLTGKPEYFTTPILPDFNSTFAFADAVSALDWHSIFTRKLTPE
jgi:hypothetical protein